MDKKMLEEKKEFLTQLMQQKVGSLGQIDNARNQLTTEIVEIRGQIALLAELIKEPEVNNVAKIVDLQDKNCQSE